MASLAKPSGGSSQSPADAERIAEMCRMRSRGMTYQAIGEQFGITKQSAQDNVARAMAKVTREAAEPLRQMELEKLDRLERAALQVLETRHVEVYQGKDTGFEDDGPKLAAIDRLVKLSETRRRLLGLDAPEQVEQTVTTVPADLVALVQQARQAEVQP